MKSNLFVVFTLIIAFISSFAYGKDWPNVEFPETAQVEIVADQMHYNGYPMKTWVVKDKRSLMVMADFFKKQWQTDSERFDARMFNGDYVINSLQPPYLLTARIAQQYGSVIAYVGITKNMDDSQLAKVNRNKFPKPNGATVLSDIQSHDLYKQGRTVILSSTQSLSSNYHYYRNHFQQRGWIATTTILDPQAGKAALQMSQGTDSVDISFDSKDSQIYIVANQVTQG
jgi:hypothetical protein